MYLAVNIVNFASYFKKSTFVTGASIINKHILTTLGKTVFLFITLLVSCQEPSVDKSMQNLNSISGNWESYKGISFNQTWQFTNDSLLEGAGFSLNNSDTSFFEKLAIIKYGNSIFYRVFLNSSKKLDFKLIEAKEYSWKFINPNNEFPSIIKYEIKNDSLLHISVSNIRGNKEQFFWLKRK
jgi:hypothetical protein